MHINHKQIIRNINISMLTDTQLKEPYKSLLKDLEEIFLDLIYDFRDGHILFYKNLNQQQKNIHTIRYTLDGSDFWIFYNILTRFYRKHHKIFFKDIQDAEGVFVWYITNTYVC